MVTKNDDPGFVSLNFGLFEYLFSNFSVGKNLPGEAVKCSFPGFVMD